jgi:hypothetical protein
MSLPSFQRPARARARAPWYYRALLAFAVAMAVALPPLPVLALVQTTNERTPTWITFPHWVKSSAPGDAVYRGMALFCEFPEQFAPRTPNPRWAEERPWRLHFVERMNPAFSRCLIRVFATWPEFVDPEIQAVLRLTFEKALPPKIGLAPVGDRQVEMKQFIFQREGTRFRLPDLTGSPDQGVTLQLTIHGKLVGEVGMQIDSNHVLRIREIRRQDLDDSPIRRGWDLR